MIRADYHIHTNFCDGKDSPESVVRAALGLGLDEIGFSAHSHTHFDESYCLAASRVEEYKAEIARLSAEYAGRISILCGIEQDIWSDAPTEGYDYVIGSVHYLKVGEHFLPVDESREIFCAVVNEHFGGDYYALAEEYFRTVAQVAELTGCDIIGHFDLVTKFNEGSALFDTRHPRYVAAARAAVDGLLKSGKPFEINTGAISRGYRTEPYPELSLMEYIAARGGEFILSSDSHSAGSLCFEFDNLRAELQSRGFKLRTVLK